MNERFIESREAVMYAREALKNGAIEEARRWAERAAELAPQNEDPWLILAAIASPRESLEYVRKALEINPNSPRAKQGMQWAMQRLGQTPGTKESPIKQKQVTGSAGGESEGKSPRKRSMIFPAILVVMGCAVFLFAAWSAATSPVMASILNMGGAAETQPPRSQSYAQVNIPKPTYTPQTVVQAPADIVELIPPTNTATALVEPTQDVSLAVVVPQFEAPTAETLVLPTDTQYVPPVQAVETQETQAVAVVEIVPDTPTPEYTQPTVAPYTPPDVASYEGEHWIDVDLSQQRLYAYAGDTLVNSFVVSTGTWQTPTVTGKYKVWIKLKSTDMSGPGYYLPDVPYTMYFYKGYGIHGTYWHNNFGTPMSHGCVNMRIPDAEWIYNFSSVGTVVNVHY